MQDLTKTKEIILTKLAVFLDDLIYNTKNDNKLSWKVNGRGKNIAPKPFESENGIYIVNTFTTELNFVNLPKLVIDIVFDRRYRSITITECKNKGIAALYTYDNTKYVFDTEMLNNSSIIDLLNILEDSIQSKRSEVMTFSTTIDNQDILKEKYKQLNDVLEAMTSIFSYEFQKSIDGVDITNSIFKLTINE